MENGKNNKIHQLFENLEIARMLSGSEITELTLKHAEELIKMWGTNKKS